ncbi:MAG: hypothetical protein ACE5J7_04865, partial [Candidatus Aenigmatarchaeota archaeon]
HHVLNRKLLLKCFSALFSIREDMPEEHATRPLDDEELKILVTYLRRYGIEPILVGGQGVMRSKGIEDDTITKDTDFLLRNGDDSRIENNFILYKLENEHIDKFVFDNIGWVAGGNLQHMPPTS